ncbi:hypothetical protein NCC78_10370 [Micromonospora phytophila]|uniref:WD40 repeat domain-containing protein n=1 Tax=Micromonospora phytophila TaxID=709888 RepID=UPI00202ED949|nr:hypothetical protein [Micromonospora phytophila]MCM0675091.1 hypothetical protein [Micromonospora phytophila]
MATTSGRTVGILRTIAAVVGLHGWLAGLIVVVATLGVAGVVTQVTPPPHPALADEAVDELPAYVLEAPKWTADIQDAPLERALVAFDINTHDGTYTDDEDKGELVFHPTFAPLTLVGPRDTYRTFDPSESGGPWTGTVELSPDGRYLMTGHNQRTQLLDVTTGQTRMLAAGAPLAWSPDGRQAVLAHFDGDQDAYPVSGQIRVVDMPSGDIRWTVPLDPGPLPRTVDAVLSPDGSTMLVQRHGDLYAYRRDHGVVWKRSTNIDGLVGQVSWKPDGRSVALADHGLCMLATDSGEQGKCVQWKPQLLGMRAGVQFYGGPEVLGWDGDDLIINAGRDVVHLSETPEILLRTPRDTRQVRIATSGVRWTARQPGPPDLGPAIHRYRPIIRIGGLTAIGIIAVIVAIRLRRHIRRRPPAG